MSEETRVLTRTEVDAVALAADLLAAAQREGLPSCSASQSWENVDQHDAMCRVKKAESGLRRLLRERQIVPVTDKEEEDG